MSITKLFTAEDLLAMGSDAPYELFEGNPRPMPSSGSRASQIGLNLAIRLGAHVRANGLGSLTGEQGGWVFERNPDSVAVPDVAFISRARHEGLMPDGFFPCPPDLAVEVVSPTDRAIEVDRKARWDIKKGVPLVWVVNPRTRSARVYRPGRDVTAVDADGELDGEDVVPGFRLPLAEVFA